MALMFAPCDTDDYVLTIDEVPLSLRLLPVQTPLPSLGQESLPVQGVTPDKSRQPASSLPSALRESRYALYTVHLNRFAWSDSQSVTHVCCSCPYSGKENERDKEDFLQLEKAELQARVQSSSLAFMCLSKCDQSQVAIYYLSSRLIDVRLSRLSAVQDRCAQEEAQS